MSATGLDVFDHSIQTTNIWLDEIIEQIGPDRKTAWKLLSAVLQTLRDRLSADLAAHLAAQLPLVIRGTYYDHYEPERQPSTLTAKEEFLSEVKARLIGARSLSAEIAVKAVFAMLNNHLSLGLVWKVREALPGSIRKLWQVDPQLEVEISLADPAR